MMSAAPSKYTCWVLEKISGRNDILVQTNQRGPQNAVVVPSEPDIHVGSSFSNRFPCANVELLPHVQVDR